MKELWRVAVGHESFEVSNFGNVRNSEGAVTPCKGQRKYLFIFDLATGHVPLHTLVGVTWLGERPSLKHFIHHIDFDVTNNAVTNLEWKTRKQVSEIELNGFYKNNTPLNPRPIPHVAGILPTSDLHPSPFVLRTSNYTEKDIAELSVSLTHFGVLVPLLVRPIGDVRFTGKTWHQVERWEIVLGHRRHRAALLAGIATVPVTAKILTDEEAQDIQLVESLTSKAVSAQDQVRYLAKLVKSKGEKRVAERLGKDVQSIKAILKRLS